ncbi:MAG: hypothetical protein JSV04_03195 [Candidatus Heimdallarchaeota archaeon]|nr:MAG: hypothetical protein JSV04_03195 [Candidatus Heimdallarchaeota archaeon]
MAVQYGVRLIDELKEVLARRRNVLDIFGTYKVTYDELLQNLANTYQTDIDMAVSAFYLSNYVFDKLKRDKEARDRTDEDDRVNRVLENLIEAKKHLTMDFESLVHMYSLLYDWAVKIEKDLVTHARLLVNQKVIMTNLVDIYAVSLFSFLKNVVPDLDLRWAMAELAGALNKGFASEFYEPMKSNFSISKMDSQFYFDAGFFVIRSFVEGYFRKKFDSGDEALELFGDIGRRPYEFSSSVFYDTVSRDLFSPIAFDDKMVPNEVLIQELNNSLHINHPSSRPGNPYQLLFGKFHVQIKIPNQRPEEKFFYIQNFEEAESNNGYPNRLGNWNYLLLSEQNVNLESIISYSKQRCIDIRGITDRLKDQDESTTDQFNTLLSGWMEMYIHNLQEEYNFLELKDELREQGFIPVGILKQDKGQPNLMEMMVEIPKKISSKRMEMLGIKSSMISREQTRHLLDHVKLVTDHCGNVLRLILLQTNPEFELTFYPVEFLYEHQKLEGRNLLLLFSSDEERMVGLICQNEASLEFQVRSLKQRQIFSKINQLLTDLRIKTITDARAAKLEGYIRHHEEDLYESGSLWLSGKIGEPFAATPAAESVTDRIDLAIKKEQARIEALKIEEEKRLDTLEKDRQTRLHAERVFYFNENILKRFFEEVSLEIQQIFLDMLREKFSGIYGLEQEYRSTKMRLSDFKAKQEEVIISKQTTEILDSLTSRIIDACKSNVIEALPELEKIWQLISNMSLDDLSKI